MVNSVILAPLERWGLRFEGFSDAQITQLEGIMPDIEHLANLATKELPAAENLLNLVEAELPRINRIVPVIAMAIRTFNAKQRGLTS
jgi:hypothetical protein